MNDSHPSGMPHVDGTPGLGQQVPRREAVPSYVPSSVPIRLALMRLVHAHLLTMTGDDTLATAAAIADDVLAHYGLKERQVPQRWQLFGRRDGDTWTTVGSARFVRQHGADPIPVVVEEDPEGDYLGWISTDDPGELTMILRKQIFNVQFPYGYQAEEERGAGRAVRLSIRAVS